MHPKGMRSKLSKDPNKSHPKIDRVSSLFMRFKPIGVFFSWAAIITLLSPQTSIGKQINESILFDGKSLKNWSITDYAGRGEVSLDGNGSVRLEFGVALTGIHWVGSELPRSNYEIRWESKKEMGSDFFGSLTFPFLKNHATLILGGWGGSCGDFLRGWFRCLRKRNGNSSSFRG